jgi:copper(I)-binding protein
MFNTIGHRGTYRIRRRAGNRAWSACTLIAAISVQPLAGCSRPADVGATARAGSITVTRAVAWSAADVKAATIGMEIGNTGDVTDTLVAVTSPAGAAMLHAEMPGQGMRPVPTLALPARSAIRMGRGLHVMVEDLRTAPGPPTS